VLDEAVPALLVLVFARFRRMTVPDNMQRKVCLMPKLKRRPGLRAFVEYLEELAQQSDRGAAIMGAAFLDDEIAGLLAFFMDPKRLDSKRKKESALEYQIFHGTGPLSSFAARINLAFALGYIDESEYWDLHIVREIRNEFAHFSYKLDFSTPEIHGLCRALKLRGETIDVDAAGLPQSDDPRDVFLNVVHKLADHIRMRLFSKCSIIQSVLPKCPSKT